MTTEIRYADKETDWDLAKAWTEADPYHKDTTKPEFWFEKRLNVESFVLEDNSGVSLFFKLQWLDEDTIEIHIQFPPVTTWDEKARVMACMEHGFSKLEETFKEVYPTRRVKFVFISESPSLIRFCVKHLGFKEEGNNVLIKRMI